MYTRGKRWFEKKKKKKLIARVGEQKETIFEEIVAILNDKNKSGH